MSRYHGTLKDLDRNSKNNRAMKRDDEILHRYLTIQAVFIFIKLTYPNEWLTWFKVFIPTYILIGFVSIVLSSLWVYLKYKKQ